MKYLWSPWRMAYVQSVKNESGCVFCNAIDQPDDPDNLILYRGERSFVILNRFPYTNGHLMIVPYDHFQSLEQLNVEARSEIMELATKWLSILRTVYKVHGFNVGVNIGEAGGAGILDHVHLHVVPRWRGDTNFMSALADTRVLPETLSDSYQRLRQAWDQQKL